MTTESETSVQYFIKELAKKNDDLQPFMKKLYDGIADVPYEDLYMLRHHLNELRADIELLNQYNDEVQEEKKTKRRFNPFKK